MALMTVISGDLAQRYCWSFSKRARSSFTMRTRLSGTRNLIHPIVSAAGEGGSESVIGRPGRGA
jgi:hypothetical protein